RLGGRVRSLMAEGAVGDLVADGELDGGEVVYRLTEADDLVRRPGFHTRQIGAVVDLVDQDLEVDGVACVGIDGLWLMAERAELRILARAAVGAERVVA